MLAVVVGAALAIAVTASIMKDRRHGEGALGEVLVSGDGRTITTLNSRAPCQQDPPRLVASESRDSVTLELQESDVDLRPQCTRIDEQITTTLQSPLGTRRLVYAGSGWTIAPFDQKRLANPRYLPPGYSPATHVQWSDSSQHDLLPPFIRTQSSGPAWTRFYHRASDKASLSITQIAGKLTVSTAGIPESVQGWVGGLSPDSNNTVTRTNGTYTFIVNTTDRNLHEAELLRITKQLTPETRD
ncbi:hypothetical protein ABT288_48065 [Streptomyces sp. NPDC001093]|uniref:hypothetical protein n=1 Tax=Streptomyces sp. NPDC001093 TaxID=3154376 RepID=UPI00331AE4B3